LVEVSDLKGVKRSSAGEDEVWLYLYGRDEAGYSDWQRAFVDPGLMSKSTWLHHKLALEKEGKVKKKLSEKTRSPVYYVDVDKREELQALAKRTEFFSKLEKLTPKVHWMIGMPSDYAVFIAVGCLLLRWSFGRTKNIRFVT
jgi:hypothetical protein